MSTNAPPPASFTVSTSAFRSANSPVGFIPVTIAFSQLRGVRRPSEAPASRRRSSPASVSVHDDTPSAIRDVLEQPRLAVDQAGRPAVSLPQAPSPEAVAHLFLGRRRCRLLDLHQVERRVEARFGGRRARRCRRARRRNRLAPGAPPAGRPTPRTRPRPRAGRPSLPRPPSSSCVAQASSRATHAFASRRQKYVRPPLSTASRSIGSCRRAIASAHRASSRSLRARTGSERSRRQHLRRVRHIDHRHDNLRAASHQRHVARRELRRREKRPELSGIDDPPRHHDGPSRVGAEARELGGAVKCRCRTARASRRASAASRAAPPRRSACR